MTALRSSILLLLLALSAHAKADVAFVSPAPGSQVIGPQRIEITTGLTAIDRVEFSVDGVLAGVTRHAPWRLAHDFGTAPGAHEISVRIFSNRYQSMETAAMRTAALSASDSYNVDLVEIPMRVHSGKTLRASDLRVRENDVEQSVREVKSERGPAHFVFIVDRSLSMSGGKLEAALEAIDAERRFLRQGDSVSIVLFNHRVSRPRPILPGEKVAALLGSNVPSGGTSLRDALASTPPAPRTYAIVITDGGDRNSELSEEEALRRISGAHIVVDALLLGGSAAPFLDRAAANTGGQILATSRDSAGRALHALIMDINSRYVLIYQSHGNGSGWRTIHVATARRGIEILNARKGYFAE